MSKVYKRSNIEESREPPRFETERRIISLQSVVSTGVAIAMMGPERPPKVGTIRECSDGGDNGNDYGDGEKEDNKMLDVCPRSQF